jgi:hypothetical protein
VRSPGAFPALCCILFLSSRSFVCAVDSATANFCLLLLTTLTTLGRPTFHTHIPVRPRRSCRNVSGIERETSMPHTALHEHGHLLAFNSTLPSSTLPFPGLEMTCSAPPSAGPAIQLRPSGQRGINEDSSLAASSSVERSFKMVNWEARDPAVSLIACLLASPCGPNFNEHVAGAVWALSHRRQGKTGARHHHQIPKGLIIEQSIEHDESIKDMK